MSASFNFMLHISASFSRSLVYFSRSVSCLMCTLSSCVHASSNGARSRSSEAYMYWSDGKGYSYTSKKAIRLLAALWPRDLTVAFPKVRRANASTVANLFCPLQCKVTNTSPLRPSSHASDGRWTRMLHFVLYIVPRRCSLWHLCPRMKASILSTSSWERGPKLMRNMRYMRYMFEFALLIKIRREAAAACYPCL